MITKTKQQNGFGLVIALLIVAFTAGIITTFITSQNGQVVRKEAEIAGMEGAKIARAARIHSRNEIANRPGLVTTLSISGGGTGPELISANQLIASDLVPGGFARNDGVNFFNALNQTISIYLANHPIDGDPTNPNTVPTAYVVFEDNDSSNPTRVQDIVNSIREQNVSVSAPLYSGGINLTGDCNGGGDTVALWDSGCLSNADYTALTGDVFVPGSFVIPVWRSVSFDTRAMMRFPQPEQTGVQTMLTDLLMAEMDDCDLDDDGVLDQNFIQIPTDSGSINSTLCRALSDDETAGAEIDNRRSIIGTASISDSIGLFIDPQSGQDVQTNNFGVMNTTGDEVNALDISGLFSGAGNGFVYGDNVNTIGLMADKNIFVSGNGGGVELAKANVAVLNANNATSTELTVQNTPAGASAFNVAVSNTARNISTLSSGNDFIAENLNNDGTGPTPTVTVNNEASFNSTITPNSVIVRANDVLNPSSPADKQYSFVAGVFRTQSLSVDQANIASTLSTRGNAIVNNTINVNNDDPSIDAECVGDCPKRERFEQCTNLQNAGLFPAYGYSTMQDCLDDG